MRLYKRGNVWYTWYFDENHKRIIQTTNCHDKKAAEQVAKRLELEGASSTKTKARKTTLQDAVDLLLKTKREQVAAKTRSQETLVFYEEKSRNLLAVLGSTFRLSSLAASDADRFVSVRRTQGVTEHTIKKELTCLRVALKLAKRAGSWLGDVDAIFPVAFSPQYKPRSRVLSPDDLNRFLGCLLPNQAAAVAFMVATGARLSECFRVQRRDIQDGMVFLRGTKTAGSMRTVPVVSPIHRSLLEYALTHGEGADPLLFRPWCSIQWDMKAACRVAEIAPVSPNDCRRSCLTWLRNSSVPLDLIAAVAGHTTTQLIQTTYGRLTPEALRDRLEASLGHPRTVAPMKQTRALESDAKAPRSAAPMVALAGIHQGCPDGVHEVVVDAPSFESGASANSATRARLVTSGYHWAIPRRPKRKTRDKCPAVAQVKQGGLKDDASGPQTAVRERRSIAQGEPSQ